MKKLIYILFCFVSLGVFSQTPGALISAPILISPATFLNPNGDAWVTENGTAYVISDHDESELPWTSIPQVDSEPSGDLNRGGACGTTDIMDDPATGADASYVLFIDPDGTSGNGDEYMVYRLRIAKDPGNGNFGFSVLMDIDERFGDDDANALAGNPGFEVEIRVKNGGGGKALYLDDVDGTTSGSNKASYNLNFYTQKSYALSQSASCSGSPAVFYDFIVPFADLNTHFGMTANTKIRLVGATSQNGATVLGTTASDIAGIDDDNYANSVAGQDLAFTDFIGNQKATAASNATGFGVLPVELGFFSGISSELGNVLNWTTLAEVNNEQFIIEKSFDGVNFEMLGAVMGVGKSVNINEYSYLDFNENKACFYRLKQVDYDGAFEYSKIISLSANSDIASINFNSALKVVNVQAKNPVNLNVVSLTGAVVYTADNVQGYVDLGFLNAGPYVAYIVTDSGVTLTEKIVIH